MSNELIKFNNEQVDLIKRTIAKDATDDELKLFMYHCSSVGLDPLAKQIFFQKYNSKNGPPSIAFITSIDGYRSTAERTGKYAGSDDAVFDNEQKPNKATVTVYKMVEGIRCAFTASARWNEYYPGDGNRGSFWRKMPCTMLAKVAEALALRKAFPKQLAGMYIREEMEQAQNDAIEAPPVDPKDSGVDSTEAAPKPNPVGKAVADHKAAAAEPPKPPAKPIEVFEATPQQCERLDKFLITSKVAKKYHPWIYKKLQGRPIGEIGLLIKDINAGKADIEIEAIDVEITADEGAPIEF